MKRIHKATVKKQIRENGRWQGYICTSNVNAYHVNQGWHIGMSVDVNSVDELNKIMKNYAWYNCNGELGQRVYCWVD